MGRVGIFASDGCHYERQQSVIVRTHRGTEIGHVLASDERGSARHTEAAPGQVVRLATERDFIAAATQREQRGPLYEACVRMVESASWPITLIDVEQVLEPSRVVLYYVSDENFEIERQPKLQFAGHALELFFDTIVDQPVDSMSEPTSRGCGSGGGCGSCGSTSQGCGTGGGCSGCAVAALVRGSEH